MKQQTLAMAADQGAEFEQYRRQTKRDVFFQSMNEIVPWTQLCEVVGFCRGKPVERYEGFMIRIA